MIVKDLQLYKEDNKYYLSAIFNHEDMIGKYEMHVPKIKLPISSNRSLNHEVETSFGKPLHTVIVDFGFGGLYAEPFTDEDHFFTLTCLEEKVHEMTLDEIEKKLGYKIKLKEN